MLSFVLLSLLLGTVFLALLVSLALSLSRARIELPASAPELLLAARAAGGAARTVGGDAEAAGSGGPPPMVFTVQKEAALRMAAKPGTKDYSAFSVLCASACRVRIAFDLAGGSFWPVPNVQSSLVVLEPRPDPIAPADRLGFSAFVRSAFSSRRKTLKNNLKAAGRPEAEVAAALEALGFSPSIRAEALRPEELAAVYGRLKAAPVPPLPTGAPGPYDAEL